MLKSQLLSKLSEKLRRYTICSKGLSRLKRTENPASLIDIGYCRVKKKGRVLGSGAWEKLREELVEN